MADHVTKFKHPEDPQLGFLTIVAVEVVKEKKDLIVWEPSSRYKHKERLEHSTQRKIFKELERERDRGRERHRERMVY